MAINRPNFYKPYLYAAPYKAGVVDTTKVVAIGPSRFTSDGVTLSVAPRTYDDETPAGTFTYLTGVNEGHTLSATIKFANMKELAQLGGGKTGTDDTHGMLEFGADNACPVLQDYAVVLVDACDTENTYKMVKIDHADVAVMTDDVTFGGSDPFTLPFMVYAHPGETPAIQFGIVEAGKVFDPTTWTIKAATQASSK